MIKKLYQMLLLTSFEQFWCTTVPLPPVRLIWILNVDSYFAYDNNNNNSSTTNRGYS